MTYLIKTIDGNGNIIESPYTGNAAQSKHIGNMTDKEIAAYAEAYKFDIIGGQVTVDLEAAGMVIQYYSLIY